MTPDEEFPAPLAELERRLIARTRPSAPAALRVRVLESRRRTSNTERAFSSRVASVIGCVAASLLVAAVFWVSLNDETAFARASDHAIVRDIELTAKQLEEIGISPSEARRSALLFYVDTKLPRLLVPQRPATRSR
jgi:hypothetical protein